MKYLMLFTVLLLVSSCTNDEDKQLIMGDWKVSEWNREADNQAIGNQMDFHFNQNDRYAVNYGYRTERGKYWFADGGLITQEDGKERKMVKIIKLTNDTLHFQMNRSGSLEEVILVRP